MKILSWLGKLLSVDIFSISRHFARFGENLLDGVKGHEMDKKVFRFVVTAEPVDRIQAFGEHQVESIAEYIRNVFDLYGVETVIVYEEVKDNSYERRDAEIERLRAAINDMISLIDEHGSPVIRGHAKRILAARE